MKRKYIYHAYEGVDEFRHRIVITVYAKSGVAADAAAKRQTYARPVLMSVTEPEPRKGLPWFDISMVLLVLAVMATVGGVVYG